MSWADALETINYTSVLLGTLIALALGAVWYAPGAFGKQWATLVGLKKKEMEDKRGMGVMMTMSALFYAMVSVVIAALVEMTGAEGVAEASLMGAILGFTFGFGPLAVTYVYARRRFDLSLIDGGYILVTCAAIGAVVGILG